MNSLPSIHFGSPSLPVHFEFQDDQGNTFFLWGHLSQCGDDYFDLWLGIDGDDPDIILRGLVEMDAFVAWLKQLPSNPQYNCQVGTTVKNTHPDLADEYKDAEHLVIHCTVGLDGARKVYSLASSLERAEDSRCFTHWPSSASLALADAMTPLLEAIRGGDIDIRPAFNPLDRQD